MPAEEMLQRLRMQRPHCRTHIIPGEVSTLQHEVWNDSMESAALVSEIMLTCAKLAKVLGGLGNNVVV